MRSFFLDSITKRFPGNDRPTLDGVSIAFPKGEISAILGENGAGKTTLMNIASGLISHDSGRILLDGEPVPNGMRGLRKSISMVHQNGTLAPNLTVSENAFLGKELLKWGIFLDRNGMRSATALVIERFGFSLNPDAYIDDLSLVGRVEAEIVRAASSGAEIIILDEPTQVLSEEEAGRIYSILRTLADAGKTIVVVTHKIQEAISWSDEVHVMRDGIIIHSSPTEAVQEQTLLAMIGFSGTGNHAAKRFRSGGDVVLAFERLVVPSPLRTTMGIADVSLAIRGGESVSIVSAPGNGLTMLENAVSGFMEPVSGRIELEGIQLYPGPFRGRFPGIGYVPQDRIGRGTASEMDVIDNLFVYKRITSAFIPMLKTEGGKAAAILKPFRFFEHPGKRASELSGGTLQKLILAREIGLPVKFLLLSHPGRGLDLPSKEILVEVLEKAKAAGTAILILTHDVDEAFLLGDRTLVLYKGKFVSEHSGNSHSDRLSAMSYRSGGSGA